MSSEAGLSGGPWSIETRVRNNHPGKKVWGLFNESEVFSLDERGLRVRDGGRVTIPNDVREEAYKVWQKIATD